MPIEWLSSRKTPIVEIAMVCLAGKYTSCVEGRAAVSGSARPVCSRERHLEGRDGYDRYDA